MGLKHFYLAHPLRAGGSIMLDKPLAHRLTRVLRLADGARLAVFNGRDGLFAATLVDARQGRLRVDDLLQPQPIRQELTLAIGLPKRDAWDSALRQATELGVTAIQPLLTRHAVADKINPERVLPRLIEAAEQCERLSLPELHPLQTLDAWLAGLSAPAAWAYERQTPTSGPITNTAMKVTTVPSAVLIGPEGGFSAEEVACLQAHPLVRPLSLGPTVLRVDTAVVAGLARLLPRV